MYFNFDKSRVMKSARVLLLVISPSFALPSGLYTTNFAPLRGRHDPANREIQDELDVRGIFDIFKKKPALSIAPPATCFGPHINSLVPGKTCTALGGVGFRKLNGDGKCLDRNKMRELKDNILGECWKPLPAEQQVVLHVKKPSTNAATEHHDEPVSSGSRPKVETKPKGPREQEKPAKPKPRPLPKPPVKRA